MKKITIMILALIAIANAAVVAHARPKFDKQPHPELVVEEHIDALNFCEVERMMAQFPENVLIVLTGQGMEGRVEGRMDVRELYIDEICFLGEGNPWFTLTPELSWTVGKTVIVQWVVEPVDGVGFLCEDYYGADAYVTKNGLLAAQVTTFNGLDLVVDPTFNSCLPPD